MQAGIEDQPAEFRRESHGALPRYSATGSRPINADETREPAQSALSDTGRRVTIGVTCDFPPRSPHYLPYFLEIPFMPNSVCSHRGGFTSLMRRRGRNLLSPESGLAPGSIAEINLQGIEENLGEARRVTIRIKTADTDDARDLAILNSQRSPGGIEIWFQVVIPADARPGPAELIATTDSSGTFTATFHISAINFGVFRDDKYGFTQAKTNRSFTNPAVGGGYLTLWGTGLGRPSPSFAPVVKVAIGGVDVRPEYFGPAPGLAGVNQMNVRIPENGVPYDCYVPVQIEVAGKPANRVTVPISDGSGPCRHPLNLTAEELRTLDAGEAIPVVTVSLSTFAVQTGHPQHSPSSV